MNRNLEKLHALGQSIWIDSISRKMLEDGTLKRYIADWFLTGLTSNPTIFAKALGESSSYDASVAELSKQGLSIEDLFFRIALQDLTAAADLFDATFRQTGGTDGWVSLEVSPLLADDARATIASATRLHAAAERDNLYIKIPGTEAGNRAIEESIFAGVPINVTLLFSREQCLASAEAYMRGIERRIAAGLDPRISSVASLFVSRWDVAVHDQVPPLLRNRLGIAVATLTYQAWSEMLASERWQRLARAGALPQRMLWASTGTKDPHAPDTMYVEALNAPDTINTVPESTLRAYADHGRIGPVLPAGGGDAAAILEEFTQAGVDVTALAARLQREGADAFADSWNALLKTLEQKVSQAGQQRRTGGE
jgi:transaldolase